jgi:hypothetical protein
MTEPRTQTVRAFAIQLALEALAERYSTKEGPNPAFRDRDRLAARQRGEEYTVERYVPRTLDQMIGDSCTIVDYGSDEEGWGPVIRSLTYREVVDAVIERLIERGIIRAADEALSTHFLCGEIDNGHICLHEIEPDGTCPNHPIGSDGLTFNEREASAARWNETVARRDRLRRASREAARAWEERGPVPPLAWPMLGGRDASTA